MKYTKHIIQEDGTIDLWEEGHKSVIAPNQGLTKYKAEIEADPNFAKYRTAENATAYEAQLEAMQPTAGEALEAWRESFSVPTYKLEIELEERGLMTTVQSLIDSASRSTQIGWEKSPTVRRMSPTMLALSQHPSLALTAEDLDDIFKSADLMEL